MVWRPRSDEEREALRAANGADLVGERWTRVLTVVALVVLAVVAAVLHLR